MLVFLPDKVSNPEGFGFHISFFDFTLLIANWAKYHNHLSIFLDPFPESKLTIK